MTRGGCSTVLLTCVVLSALVGCSKKTPERAPNQVQPVEKTAARASVGGDQKLDPNDPKHGTRRLMGLDTPVYVDGVQVAVLRYGDMPSFAHDTLEGGTARYRIYDYLKAIGVSPESIKAIHLHANGDRIGSIEGAELLKEKARFEFQFSSGTTGAPLQRWSGTGLKNAFVVHEIRKMTIYSNKPVPEIKAGNLCHVDLNGECTDAIPYAAGEAAKGTRVYVDGKMVGFVKRRKLSEAVVVGHVDGEPKFSVDKLLTQFGVDPSRTNSVELVAGDDVVARADKDQWSKLSSDVTFTLPKHMHGKVRVHVPSELSATMGDKGREALVSSVLVYSRTKPEARPLAEISEDTDLSVALAASDSRSKD